MPETTCGEINPETGSACRLEPNLHASHVAGYGPTFEHWSRPSSQIDAPKSEPGRLVEVARRITGREVDDEEESMRNMEQDGQRSRAAAEDAIEQVDSHADEAWKVRALEAVRRTALTYESFTTDEVWETGLPVPREGRAMGAIMRRAASRGWIERTDRVRPTSQVKSHSSPIAIWISLIHGEEDPPETPLPPPGLLAL